MIYLFSRLRSNRHIPCVQCERATLPILNDLPSIYPSLKTPKSEYPTCIKSRNLIPPKSQFTERLFIRGSENLKSYSPELLLLRSTVLLKVSNPGQSRKCHCSELLSLRCPSYTYIDVLLPNEQHKANEHWILVRAEYSQLIAASQMSKIISSALTLTSVIPSNFRSRRWLYIKSCMIRMYSTYTSSILFD